MRAARVTVAQVTQLNRLGHLSHHSIRSSLSTRTIKLPIVRPPRGAVPRWPIEVVTLATPALPPKPPLPARAAHPANLKAQPTVRVVPIKTAPTNQKALSAR